MSKNLLIGQISKTALLSKIYAGTDTFKRIYNQGVPVAVAGKAKEISEDVKSAIEALKKAKMFTMAASVEMAATDLCKSCDVPSSSALPTGKDLEKQFLTFVPFAAVVPLRNRNNHKYAIGEPVIMVIGTEGANTGMYGMDKYGCVGQTGNELPRLRKSLRPATRFEIDKMVDYLYR